MHSANATINFRGMKLTKAVFSKTGYIKGKQCLKSLYLYKHYYSLRDPLPPERINRFNLGSAFGISARALFPNGQDASPSHVHRYAESVKRTRQMIREGVTTIYEAAFLYNGILIYADILTLLASGWALYEVKSSLKISKVYEQDLALQYYVISESGIQLSHAGFIHLKEALPESYKEQDISTFCQLTDYTELCHSAQQRIESEINEMKIVLAGSQIPPISMGDHCQTPYPCDFIGFCTKQMNPPAEGLFKD